MKISGDGNEGVKVKATEFYDAFPPKPTGNAPFKTETLLDVLTNRAMGNTDQVGRYVVAALLNSAANLNTNVLSATVIQHIWAEYATTGHFTPMPGASWGAAEIVDYLNSTMPNP